MTEKAVVDVIYKEYADKGLTVAKEVANFYRSADIAALDHKENVIVIECKLNSISRAIKQSMTHKQSADKVYIGTTYKNTRQETIDKITSAGLGLLYVMPDGTVKEEIVAPNNSNLWGPAKIKLINRIREEIND